MTSSMKRQRSFQCPAYLAFLFKYSLSFYRVSTEKLQHINSSKVCVFQKRQSYYVLNVYQEETVGECINANNIK